MKASVRVCENVYWVGAVDWSERDFHNFETHRGLTYNSYLVVDEKVALIDGVKHRFVQDQLRKVEEHADLKDIEYLVVNHVEPDHSSGVPEIVKRVNPVVVCSKRGKEGLEYYYGCEDWDFKVVKTGDKIELGELTLTFLETPMLHWPDSMMTWLDERKVLFSMDGFGQHIASSERFDDELGVEEAIRWAKVYYANILMPFGKNFLRTLDRMKEMKIEPEIIAPSHGVIWRNPGRIVEEYVRWANFESDRKAVIIYDTMWHSTEKLAMAIAEGIASKGVKVRVFHVRRDAWADIMTEVLDAKAICIGSPTMHGTVFPPMAGFLTYMKGLRPKRKIATAFSSYGWGVGAYEELMEFLRKMDFEVTEGIKVRYRPNEEELDVARNLGERVGEMVLNSS